jgi:CBS domain-containing protein
VAVSLHDLQRARSPAYGLKPSSPLEKEVDMRALRAYLPRRFRSRTTFPLPPAAVLGTLLAASTAATAALWLGRRARTAKGRVVKDIMVGDVLTIEASASLLEAAELMRDGNVGVLPVVEDGCLRGIVTDRDLVVRGMANGADPATTRVAQCATWDIVCAHADSSIEDAMEVMADSQIGRLPVVDADNRVIGILTLSSLALRSSKQEDALETAQEVSKRSARAA